MPIVLFIVGALVIIAAIKGDEHKLAAQLANDFTGNQSFLIWITAIGSVGAVGYVPSLKKFSDTLLVLILLSFTLKNGGFFTQLKNLVGNPPTAAPSVQIADPAPQAQPPGSSYGDPIYIAEQGQTTENVV